MSELHKLELLILFDPFRADEQGPAYMNRFVKQKEQDIEDSYHSINLKEMKPVTSKHMTNQETRLINNSKREMIKQVRDIEIERENKVLLQKISSVMSKKGAYSVNKPKNIRTKLNKSLNQFYRKRQMEEIELENKRFVHRLHQKKPTLNMEKINREWLDNKSCIKRMANCQFNLTSIRSNSRVQSITQEKFYKSKYDKARVTKFKNFDGIKMLVKVQFTDQVLKITGDTQNSKDLKVIEVPRDQAIVFIEKEYNGRIEGVVHKLKYDSNTETLFLVNDNLQDGEEDISQFNPEIDKIITKKKDELRRRQYHISKNTSETTNKGYSEGSKKTAEPKEAKKKNTDKKVVEEKKAEEIKTISVVEEQNQHSQKASERKIEPQAPLDKQTPVEEPVPVQTNVDTPEQHVVEEKEAIIEPQQDVYEEEKFQESANLPQTKKETQPKVENKEPSVKQAQAKPEAKEPEVKEASIKQAKVKEEVKEPEVKEPEVKQVESKPEAKEPEVKEAQQKEPQVKKQVIVAPEQVEDYKEQFEEADNKEKLPQTPKQQL